MGALTLNLHLRYSVKPTESHSNAHGLFRLPLPVIDTREERDEGTSIFCVSQILSVPATFQTIQQATKYNAVLSEVLTYTREGWPSQVPRPLQLYYSRKDEITVQSDCLLWGIRVFVTKSLQSQVLLTLHEWHPGIPRMKSLARSYMWWTGMD